MYIVYSRAQMGRSDGSGIQQLRSMASERRHAAYTLLNKRGAVLSHSPSSFIPFVVCVL